MEFSYYAKSNILNKGYLCIEEALLTALKLSSVRLRAVTVSELVAAEFCKPRVHGITLRLSNNNRQCLLVPLMRVNKWNGAVLAQEICRHFQSLIEEKFAGIFRTVKCLFFYSDTMRDRFIRQDWCPSFNTSAEKTCTDEAGPNRRLLIEVRKRICPSAASPSVHIRVVPPLWCCFHIFSTIEG